jgi:hypothetical protein
MNDILAPKGTISEMIGTLKHLRAEVSNLRGTARLHKERADALTARVKELEKVLSDGVFVLDDLTASRVDDEVLTSLIDEFRAAITQEKRDE